MTNVLALLTPKSVPLRRATAHIVRSAILEYFFPPTPVRKYGSREEPNYAPRPVRSLREKGNRTFILFCVFHCSYNNVSCPVLHFNYYEAPVVTFELLYNSTAGALINKLCQVAVSQISRQHVNVSLCICRHRRSESDGSVFPLMLATNVV